jgi:hypothetical protein
MTLEVGLPFQIGIASRSSSVPLTEVVRVTAALNTQIARDFAPIWGVSAMVVAIPNPDSIDPGIWPLFVDDDIGVDAEGFHQTEHNQPYALISAGRTWSITASHECLELLADPTGSRLYPSMGVTVKNGEFQDLPETKFEYLVELCDPCEGPDGAYLINGVAVSDFYTPHYFDPVTVASVRYSFSGRITRPRQVLQGGYLSWRDPDGKSFRQARLLERPEIVTIPIPPTAMGNRPLRGLVDQYSASRRQSDLAPTSAIVEARTARGSWLGVTNAARAALYSARPSAPPPEVAETSADQVAATIKANLETFRRPGVFAVRPGWLLADGWLRHKRAIVVIVDPDQIVTLRAALPAEVEGVPVDVRPANPLQALRRDEPKRYAVLAAGPRLEYALPEFKGEVRFDAAGAGTERELLEAARSQKDPLKYERPTGVSLEAFEEEMDLTLNISPDAGWQVLRDFLVNSPGDLVAGMYDFTSPHIEQALLQGLGSNKKLTLTLDHPAGKETREQTIDKTVDDLEELGRRVAFAWALEKMDRKVSAYIYPSAYHIKVVVRSDDVLWLSSGNFNTTNQPEIDLSDRASAIQTAKTNDRDWHIVAKSATLSKIFRAYLEKDNEVALRYQLADQGLTAAAHSDEIPPELLVMEAARPKAPTTFFQPKTVSGRFRVRPLLTPFDYQKPILELIQTAQSRFWMQTQYIKVSGREGDEDHDALIAAVAERAKAGVDVKLITSEFQTADLIEQLMDAGIDSSLIRIQPHVHNKGMVVDSRHVVISSQNWSSAGTLRNRDAGVILYDNLEAAKYFEEIFLHDWAHMASPEVVN